MPKPAPKTAPSAPSTFDQAVKALENNPKAVNPYEAIPATETTSARKTRLGLAHRFESAREKVELAANRAVGIVGRFGRVPATVKGFALLATKTATDGTFRFNDIVTAANEAFIAHNPDMKVTVNSARLYAQELADFARLLGLLEYQPAAKTYRFTSTFRSLLTGK